MTLNVYRVVRTVVYREQNLIDDLRLVKHDSYRTKINTRLAYS